MGGSVFLGGLKGATLSTELLSPISWSRAASAPAFQLYRLPVSTLLGNSPTRKSQAMCCSGPELSTSEKRSRCRQNLEWDLHSGEASRARHPHPKKAISPRNRSKAA